MGEGAGYASFIFFGMTARLMIFGIAHAIRAGFCNIFNVKRAPVAASK
jgi:hypothetical protein